MISDKCARLLASSWHGGGGSALYALASTGAIDTARSDHSVSVEIVEAARGTTDKVDRANLANLLTYVLNKRQRGEVRGWNDQPWM